MLFNQYLNFSIDGWLTSIFLVIYGVILILSGKFLLRIFIGLGFGLILSYFVFIIFSYLEAGTIASLLISFIAFIIGFFLGWFIFKITLSFIIGLFFSALIGSYFKLFNETILFLVIVIICIVIAYLLIEKIISLIILIAGSFMVFIGISTLIGDFLIGTILSIIIIVILILTKYFLLK